jgi:hypothetical protein
MDGAAQPALDPCHVSYDAGGPAEYVNVVVIVPSDTTSGPAFSDGSAPA